MAKRKYYFYVGVVLSDCQFRFVTSVNNGDHTCSWDKTEKPSVASWFADEIRSMRIINYDDAVRKYHYGGNVK